jgi:hypothetical protein
MFESIAIPLLEVRSKALDSLHASLRALADKCSLDYADTFERLSAQLNEQIRTASQDYTICVIGEFKVGKSTFLNGLVGLSGDAALSTAESLDTACSVIIRGRGADDPEALLVFKSSSGLPSRKTTWQDAKRYTSKQRRGSDARVTEESRFIERVEYFVDNPALSSVQFNDLPGTGTIYSREDTAAAEKSMQTADVILWLVFDDEPGADGTRFLDPLARAQRKLTPIVNVREDPPAPPDLDVADLIADRITARYVQHFADGISRPFLYSARVIELERAKAVPDSAVLEAAGYDALISHLFCSDSATQRAKAKEARVGASCRQIFREAAACLRDQLPGLCDARLEKEKTQKEFARSISGLDGIHERVHAQLVNLSEAYAKAVCEVMSESVTRFVDHEVKITNPELLKSRWKGTKEFTGDFAARFERDYLPAAQLTKLKQDHNRRARQVLADAWRSLDPSWSAVSDADVETSSGVQVVDGADLNKALTTAALKVLTGAGLLILLYFFPEAVVVAPPITERLTGNPMETMRERARDRTFQVIRGSGLQLEDKFLSAWLDKSYAIQDRIRTNLGASGSSAAREIADLQEISQRLTDEAAAFESAAEKLYWEQTGRGVGA